MKFYVLFTVFFLSIFAENTANIYGQLALPPIFSDNMVLQRNSTVIIWGTDFPDQKVKVNSSWGGASETITNDNGKWALELKTNNSREPQKLKIEGSSGVTYNNVLFGEVWLCSGQSNMEMPMKGFANQPIANSNEAILNSANSNIRLFQVERNFSERPQDVIQGNWVNASPETVVDFSATAYFFGQKLNDLLDVPIGLIHASWGGSHIEAWLSNETFSVAKEELGLRCAGEPNAANIPSGLFNGMIHPITNYKIRGTIWYQGESNVCNPKDYDLLFKTLIESWRTEWNTPDLPFYYAQIAPFNYENHNAALLREVQENMMDKLENVGMAATIDIGECDDIHPRAKKEVGNRLAYWALAQTYGVKGFSYASPRYKKMELTEEESKIKIYFDAVAEGLFISEEGSLSLEIAGENKLFVPAQVKINRDKTLLVWSEKVTKPKAVRYAFKSCSSGGLYNTAGLPVLPFRTDSW